MKGAVSTAGMAVALMAGLILMGMVIVWKHLACSADALWRAGLGRHER